MKRSRLLLAWLLCLATYAISAGEPGRFAVSQATFQPPILTTYVDVLDQNGQPPASISVSEISASIAGRELKVASVTPFDASREGVAYIFLVDVSKSILRPQFEAMRTAIDDWINGLTANDRMAIFAFGERDRQIIDFTSDKASLKAALRTVVPTDLKTKLYLALANAINLGQRTDAGLPNRRAIVIVSDGKDEGSGYTESDVRNLVQRSPMPIYAIGSSQLPMQERAQYLEALNRLATLSGGLYVESKFLPAAYGEMKQAIRRVFVVQLGCEGCLVGTQSQPLEMTLRTGGTARTDRLAVSLIVPPPEKPWWQQLLEKISLKVVLSLVVVFAIVVVVVVRVVITIGKKPKPEPIPTPTPVAVAVLTPVKPSPAGREVQFTVVSGKDHGRVDHVSLSGKTVIGRDKKCDVSYPDDSEMSAKHYELILAGDRVEVLDLGSTNGTLLNGARLVTQQRIEDGDLVRAGRTEVRINFGT